MLVKDLTVGTRASVVLAATLVGWASPLLAAPVRTNDAFVVSWDGRDGGLSSLVMCGDGAGMNWIDGTGTWGVPYARRIEFEPSTGRDRFGSAPFFAFRGTEASGDSVVSHYGRGNVEVDVVRRMEKSALVETYSIRNSGPVPEYFLRGQFGLLATFNDEYDRADVCQSLRCHAHVFTGGEVTWVHALKMGPYRTELLLTLEEGSVDGYSIRRRQASSSNDRGDFILHLAPFHLLPGEAKTVRFRLAAIPAGSFEPPVRFKDETVFPGEAFELFAGGREYRFPAGVPGEEQTFEVEVGGRTCRVVGYTSPTVEELAARRVRFIVKNQQCREMGNPLDGAFLIWDSEDRQPFFDECWRDHNASRERIGMGLLLARWLRTHDDAEVADALDRFVAFMVRECFNPDTGEVFDGIRRRAVPYRHYNVPWVATLWEEMYELRRDSRYLDWMERTIRGYYSRRGADGFYPVDCNFARQIRLLKDLGRPVDDLVRRHGEHVRRLVTNGTRYPPHEVRYEQSIAAPAVSILTEYCRVFGRDEAIMSAARQNLAVLDRFSGHQPDHRQAEQPIRHWDGFWFGKIHSLGDTLHYWNAMTATAFLSWADLTGEAVWRARAEKCLRNLLFLYRPDGFASCAYYLPYSMVRTDKDGREFEAAVRGERFDTFANDQDFGLYHCLCNCP